MQKNGIKCDCTNKVELDPENVANSKEDESYQEEGGIVACDHCRHSFQEPGCYPECRRRSPRAGKDGSPIWPRVRDEDWCGEFEKGVL